MASKTRKSKETAQQILDRWVAGNSGQHIVEVLNNYGRCAGLGARIEVDGITYERVTFADNPALEHLGDGYCVVELDSDGNAA